MKRVSVGQKVTHYGRQGAVETVEDDGLYACVVLSGLDGWPFPERRVIRVSELKRDTTKAVQEQPEFEEAPF